VPALRKIVEPHLDDELADDLSIRFIEVARQRLEPFPRLRIEPQHEPFPVIAGVMRALRCGFPPLCVPGLPALRKVCRRDLAHHLP
jgi:hypothetical protein